MTFGRRIVLGLSFLLLAAGTVGCGHSLAGTSWAVVEINGKTDADQAAVEGVDSIQVDFRTDARLRTTIKRKDGTIDREEDETYKVTGDTIVIRHPNYERRVQINLTGDRMTVSSDRYQATLERIRQSEADQPAMFRPSSIGRTEYRSLSTMPRTGGIRR